MIHPVRAVAGALALAACVSMTACATSVAQVTRDHDTEVRAVDDRYAGSLAQARQWDVRGLDNMPAAGIMWIVLSAIVGVVVLVGAALALRHTRIMDGRAAPRRTNRHDAAVARAEAEKARATRPQCPSCGYDPQAMDDVRESRGVHIDESTADRSR